MPLSGYSSNDNFFGNLFGKKDKTEKQDKRKEKDRDVKIPEDLYDLTIEENLTILDLDKYAPHIRNYQKSQAVLIKKNKYQTELMRNGEIIVVSIPSRDLFIQNDSLLTLKGKNLLTPFLNYLKEDDYYRVLIVMHSDNTGTDNYSYKLTKRRIESVFGWFEENSQNTDYLIPYAMGNNMPVKPNNSLKNRDYNRRLEIYLIPGSKMLSMSKKGKL